MSDIGSFKYEIKPWNGLFFIALFGAISYLCFILGMGTDGPLTIKRVEIDEETAKLIYYGLSILMATGAGYMLLMVANGLLHDIRITITADAISAPKGALNNTLITIPFSQVSDLKNTLDDEGDEHLIISSAQSSIMIYNKFCRGYDFKTIKRIVRQRVKECAAQEPQPD
ncbi:MAG TPA: hypothetical protein DCS30_06000 [Rhizobiales bacterium]|nr:hypothetical protein [Hyphomicrobiales bacterium]